MKLDDLMRHATDDTKPDVARLTQTARSQARSIRRRRMSAVGAGVAAVSTCAVVISVAASMSLSGPGPEAGRDQATSPAPASSSTQQGAGSRETVPLDGRATAALLQAAVDDLVDGTASEFAGQGPGRVGRDTYAELTLTGTGDDGAGVVGVNVQDLEILAGQPRTCLSFMSDCTVSRLPGGDLLRAYRDQSDTGEDVRLVAELLSASRQLRVVVSATNGFDLGGNEWEITRSEPVLTADQLRAVATDERWGFRVAAQYAEQGAALEGYRDLDSDSDVEVVPTPTPTASAEAG